MKLLIHDLPDTPFRDLTEDFTVIGAPDKAAPCQGCFKCWTKNAGYCVYADSLQHSDALAGTGRFSQALCSYAKTWKSYYSISL